MSNPNPTISLNKDYLKSKAGILRIFEAIIGICGIICESVGGYCNYGGMYSFYNFVVVTTLIIAIIILIIYFFSLDQHLRFMCAFVNCPLTVFINDVIFTILYLIAAILMFVTVFGCRYRQVARIFASLFGVCGTIVVGLLAFDGYQLHRSAQSEPKSDPA
ncbi:proteolipid protein 2-like [Uloborus diversus]|uniref:proteolipid protein 2-like n=1 Tax=Uloborus diversus TaxID=327109 RepID=UPI002409AF3F|nr:proteolipid protein 2-like [Uloborus diversus]